MDINEIITKYYDTFKSQCHNDYTVISCSKTSEDILNDVFITAIRKYKTKEVDETEAFEYIKKTLYYELKFQHNRIDNRIIYTDDLTAFE